MHSVSDTLYKSVHWVLLKAGSVFASLRRRRPWIAGAVFAIACIIYLLSYFAKPEQTPFTASVETRSIAFTVGDWPDSAGLFVQERMPVDLTVQTPCDLRSASTNESLGKAHRGQTFRQTVLMSMDVSRGVRMAIDVEDGILIFNLERPAAPQHWSPLQFEFTNGSPDLPAQRPPNEQLKLMPDPETRSVEFSLRFQDSPEPQLNIPIQAGSNISFQKETVSQLLPKTAVLLLRDDNTKLLGDSGIALDHLAGGAVEELVVKPKQNGASGWTTDGTGQERRAESNRAPPFQVDFLSLRISGVTHDICVQNVPGAPCTPIKRSRLSSVRSLFRSSELQGLAVLLGVLGFLLEEYHRLLERDKNGSGKE
jgi:hypothetical protein